MTEKWLNIINILITIPVILLIAIFFWVYMRTQFAWGVILIFLVLLLVGYLNVRRPIHDYIDARRKAKNRPVDIKGERQLRILNFIAILAVLAVLLIGWIYFAEQIVWAIYCAMLILILVLIINARKVIMDIS